MKKLQKEIWLNCIHIYWEWDLQIFGLLVLYLPTYLEFVFFLPKCFRTNFKQEEGLANSFKEISLQISPDVMTQDGKEYLRSLLSIKKDIKSINQKIEQWKKHGLLPFAEEGSIIPSLEWSQFLELFTDDVIYTAESLCIAFNIDRDRWEKGITYQYTGTNLKFKWEIPEIDEYSIYELETRLCNSHYISQKKNIALSQMS